MKFKIIYIVALVFFLIIIAIGSYTMIKNYDLNSINLFNTNQTNNNRSNNTSIILPSPIIDYNSSLTIPSNDYVINQINWSNYPNLERGYVQDVQILDTNGGTINHKFIDVSIYVEIKTEDNDSTILDQMKGVLKETRTIYGPNSRIFIFCNKNGVFDHAIDLLPYDDTIYGS
jgi:hypothetical protein